MKHSQHWSLFLQMSWAEQSAVGITQHHYGNKKGKDLGVDSSRIESLHLSCPSIDRPDTGVASWVEFSLSFSYLLLSPLDLHTDTSQPEMTVTAYSSPYYSCHIIPVSTSLSSLSVRRHSILLFTWAPLLPAQTCTIRQAAASLCTVNYQPG